MEIFIRQEVESGNYGSPTEVVEAALARMRAEQGLFEVPEWSQAIREGAAAFERGDSVPCNDATLRQITAAALKSVRSGKPVDPDDLP